MAQRAPEHGHKRVAEYVYEIEEEVSGQWSVVSGANQIRRQPKHAATDNGHGQRPAGFKMSVNELPIPITTRPSTTWTASRFWPNG